MGDKSDLLLILTLLASLQVSKGTGKLNLALLEGLILIGYLKSNKTPHVK